MPQLTRLIIVDDDPQVRRSIRMRLRLEPLIDVVGDAADGPTAIALARAARPDVILLDLHLQGMSGLQLCRRLVGLGFAVVMFSLDDSEHACRSCLGSGAAAFVPKRAPVAYLIGAILRTRPGPRHAAPE